MRSAAVFMLALIILLPINTSIAYGGVSIGNAVVTGADGLPGIRRPYDVTKITADIKIDDSVVDPANVKYGEANSYLHFSQCSGSSGEVHQCIYTSGMVSLTSGSAQFKITVVDDNGDPLKTHSGSMIIDGEPPKITSLVVNDEYGDETVSVKFSVKDYVKEGDSNSCSGLKQIELRAPTNVIATETLGGSCSQSGTIEIESSRIGSSSGDHEICLVATDALNQESDPYCKTLTLDVTKPSVLSSKILDLSFKPVTYIMDNQIVFEVNISEEDTSISTTDVQANFSNIHDSMKSFESADTCTPNDNVYTCRWTLGYTITETGTHQIGIKVTDAMGNMIETQVSNTFYIDNTNPEVNLLKSEIMYGGVSYLKKLNNTIIASIDDSGSGISKEDVFLDTNKFNENSRTPASNCTNYICYWYGFDAKHGDEGERILSMTSDSIDNTGNYFDSTGPTTFILIHTKPQIDYSNWTTYGQYSGYNLSYAVIGDQILFNFTIQYSRSPTMTAVADFTELVGNPSYNEIPGSCSLNETTWYCEFATTLNASGSKTAHFTFTDVVGYESTDDFTLDIKYADNATEKNWNYRVLSVSPKSIDRQTTTLINHKVYANIQFTPKSGIIGEAIELVSCSADEKSSLIYDIKRIETQEYQEWLKTTLQAAKFNGTDKLEVVCTHKILSLVDDEYLNEELLNVTFPIKFYNMPLGELSDSVQDEIDRVNESWLVQQEWLDTAYKLVQLYTTLCRVVGMIENIRLILCGLRDLTCPNIVTYEAAQGFGKLCHEQTLLGKGTWAGVNKFCKANSCLMMGLIEQESPELAKKINDFFTTFYGSKNFMEQSLPLSMLFVCLKGLVQNLQKARLIECQYIQCLSSEVPSGKPLQACTMTRGYMQCKWIYGQLFNLVPFASVFSKFAQDIDRVMTDPITAVNMVAGFACKFACDDVICGACTACTFLEVLNMVVDLYKDLEEMGKDDFSGFNIGDSVCQDVLGTGG